MFMLKTNLTTESRHLHRATVHLGYTSKQFVATNKIS